MPDPIIIDEPQERYHEYMKRLYRKDNMVSNKNLETPINNIQQLMAITAEECGELTQVCMKILRKYDTLDGVNSDEKWQTSLVEEVGDVLCMIELMVEHGLVTHEEIEARATVKREKLKKWSTLVE